MTCIIGLKKDNNTINNILTFLGKVSDMSGNNAFVLQGLYILLWKACGTDFQRNSVRDPYFSVRA